ncbi:MAG: ABC transporter substrate-binding protein [Microthrixaceae bacterium]
MGWGLAQARRRQRQPLRQRRTAAIAAVIVVLGSACGSSDSDDTASSDAEASGPTYGGTLEYAITAETTGGWCLPEAQLVAPGVQVARAVYDQLTAPDENGEIAPFLAEEVVPNDTYDTWTIRLREGIEFHDGSALDAEVVKNNLDAYRGTYPNRSPLLFRFVLDNIAAVEVVDDLTVEVRTATPWVAFPWYLWNDGRMGIMAQAQLDDPGETCDSELVGTGPFVAGEWRVNDSFTMTRNEDYWRTDGEGNQLPYLDGVVFRPVIEGATRINMLAAGEVDVIHTATTRDIDTLESLGDDIDLSIAEGGNGVYYFQLNSGEGKIFDDRTARLAAAYAIDREQINQVTDLDALELASGPFMPGEMGYLEDAGYPEFDPDRARELVQQVEREQGRPFEVTLMTTTGTSTAPDQVQEMLEDVGIEVNRKQFEASSFIDQALSGSYDLMLVVNHPAGDPDLQEIWWSSDSPVNLGRIEDPELDALLEQGRVETDPAERTEVYEEVNRLFAEQVYNLWQAYNRWAVATGTDVHGVLDTPLPDGTAPAPNLSAGHSLASTWISGSS